MARAGSEDPRDVANLQELSSRLQGLLGEAERLLTLAEQTAKENTLAADRAATERRAATETTTRRRAVGVGGTPTGVAPATAEARAVEATAGYEERAVRAQAERLAQARALGAAESKTTLELAEQVRLAELQSRTGGLAGTGAAPKYGPTPAAIAAARVQAAATAPPPNPAIASLQAQAQAEAARARQQLPLAAPKVQAPIKLSELSQLSAAEQALYERSKAVTYSEGDLTRSIAFNSRTVGLANDAYTRNGYLTSEFIQAAARGQVTFRELSNQVGGTIAKFAGWTAAASAVYGALGAVKALGTGAIKSADGVQLLNRVIDQTKRGGISNSDIQERVAGLSRKFNVPIDDANQAVYGSLKAFHGDLPQALQASEQALFGVKVGELTAADSTKYLTAIVNGFKLSAKDLPLLFDTINQAQNRFGGNTGQLVAGVSKAGGAFRLAGGNYRELIAILTAGSRLTGATPAEVGTAVSRSAGRVLTSQGQAALLAAGLNPQQSYPKLLAQASQLAQGASRQRVQELARALIPAGGQFARIFAPLLQNRQLYNNVFQAIAPDQARGSAARELSRVLAEPGEQIRRLGGDLERLGVEIARLHGLALPGAFIATLDEGLKLTRGLLGVFNDLTSIVPFKGAIVGALELLAVMKLLRRFDVGNSLPVGREGSAYSAIRGSLQRSEPAAFRAQALLGLSDQKKFIEQERSRAAISAGSIDTRRVLAAQTVTNLHASGAPEAEISRAQARYEQLSAQFEEQIALENAYREQAVITERQITGLQAKNLKSMAALRAAMEAEGIAYTLPTLARPIGERPIPTSIAAGETSAGGVILPGGSPVGPVEEQIAAEQAATREQGRFQNAMARGGKTTAALGAGATRGAAVARTAAGAARGAATGLLSFLKALGPLDIALIGFVVALDGMSKVHEYNQRAKAAQDAINQQAGGAAGVSANARKIGNGPGAFGDIVQAGSDLITHPLDSLFGNREQDRLDARKAAQSKGLALAARIKALNSQGLDLPLVAIDAQLQGNLDKSTTGAQQIAAYDNAIRQNLRDRVRMNKEVTGTPASQADIQANEQALADLKARRIQAIVNARSLGAANQTAHLGLPGLVTYDQGTASRLQLEGPTQTNSTRLQATANRLTQLRNKRSDADIANVIKLVGQMNQEAQQIVDRYVAAHPSTDPGTQANVRLAGIAQARRAFNLPAIKRRAENLRAAIKGFSDSEKQAEQEIAGLQHSLTAEGRGGAGFRGSVGPVEARMQGLAAVAASDKAKVGQARRALTIVEQILSQVFGSLQQSAQEAGQAKFQAAQDLYDAQTALAAAQAGGGTAGDRVTLGRNESRLPAIAKQYGRNSTQWYSAQTDIISTQNSINADQKAKADAARQKAKQAADDARRNAQELLAAQKAYALSGFDPSNTLRAARVTLRYDQRAVGLAGSAAERLQARAQVRTDQRAVADATIQSKWDTIEYHASIGKLSHDAEIAQLEALRKRIHGNQDLRRKITEEIYKLKHDADASLDQLNIGNIKLPTIYDIRRLAQQGTNSAPVNVNHTSNFTINGATDPEATGRAVERYVTTGLKSGMRSAGLR